MARPWIAWFDEEIDILTDPDGNYSGVLVEKIDRLLGYHRGIKGIKSDVTFEVGSIFAIRDVGKVEMHPPFSSVTINENNDLMCI